MKDFQNSLADFNRAEKLNSNDPALFLNRGTTYHAMKRWELAIPDLTRAIELGSTDKKPYLMRAECYNFSGKTELAQKDLEQVLKIDGTDKQAKINLAFCYISTKKFNEANSLYQELYITEKHNPYVLNNFGYVKHMLGNSEEGIKLIQKSLEIKPDNSYAYKYLAEIYFSLNQPKKACEAINEGLKLGFTKAYGPELQDLQKEKCQ